MHSAAGPPIDAGSALCDLRAEVMRPGYDKQAAQFFTGNHNADAGFQRVGKELAEAKLAKGITSL